MTSRPWPVIAVICAACGSTGPGPSIPTPVGGFRPEDRVVIGDFSHVNAIASTFDRVYVVYPTAIATWYPVERRWDLPVTPEFADRLSTVTGAVVDPADRSLWMATPTTWLRYDPFVYGGASPALPPQALRRPVTVTDAMRDLPQLRALAPRIATGPGQVQGIITAAAHDPQGHGWYLGTSTRGLLFMDRMASDATPIPMGLSGDVVSAILPTPDGIWVATEADPGHPAGVTCLSSDLGTSSPLTGSLIEGLPFNTVHRFLVTAGPVWMATDKGIALTSKDHARIERFDISGGLPDERVMTLAEQRGQIVAGTLRGLAASPGDSAFRRVAPDFTGPVYALLARGDTLWVGTSRGLFASIPGSDDLGMPEGFHQLPGSLVPIMGIGYVSDTLVAMTPDRLLWRNPASGDWNEGPELSAQLGALVALDASAQGAWVAGPRGVAFVRPGTNPLRFLTTPGQLPGEVTTVAMRGPYLWIGTRAGLVRYLLESQ
jgi:hypothetical protein